ncbi:protein of unknown function [Clostridium gasigenes]|uniref:IrrE N-terminal-like domain-containing protein n=2 Tax=Clostridium gasigenes TaxID=94869 RepID=A0A1H0VGQ5_9CLOT|nr:protein of unknown function [Clostridium gasigenes]
MNKLTLEKKLSNVRKMANRVFEKEGLTIPVDIFTLIKKFAKLECVDIPFSDAICVDLEKCPTVIYNDDTQHTRLRFTLAHELGHIKIPWHTGIVSCHTEDDLANMEHEYEEMEKEANTFASELLIPTLWLQSIFNEERDYGLEKIINLVSEKAQVSKLAVLYAINENLPEGYIVFVENKQYDFIAKKEGYKRNILHLYDRGDYSIEWLMINAKNSGEINLYNSNVYWIDLGRQMEENDLKSMLTDISCAKLESICYELFEDKSLSPANILKIIIDSLPKSFIMKVNLNNSNYVRYVKSSGTYISNKLESVSDRECTKWYYDNSCESMEYKNNEFSITVWKFEDYILNSHDFSEKRNSKLILRSIVDGNYYENERIIILGRINGVIGSLNNKKKELTQQQFYNALKQRFVGREDLQYIVLHRDFNNFLIKKTIELYSY